MTRPNDLTPTLDELGTVVRDCERDELNAYAAFLDSSNSGQLAIIAARSVWEDAREETLFALNAYFVAAEAERAKGRAA